MIFDDSGLSKIYINLPLKKMERANLVLYINGDGTIEIVKNRYSGMIGSINNKTGVEILLQLLVRTAYNNTCEIFQEALKKDIYRVLENHKVLEGEENEQTKCSIYNKSI